jgi:hypothetical protein
MASVDLDEFLPVTFKVDVVGRLKKSRVLNVSRIVASQANLKGRLWSIARTTHSEQETTTLCPHDGHQSGLA